MTFEWDFEKSQSNLRKHGVSFEMASEVFFDENAFSLQDDRLDYNEPREILIGLLVCWSVAILVCWILNPARRNARSD